MTDTVARLQQVQRREASNVRIDGRPVAAYLGETVATVLMSAGHRRLFEVEPPYPPSRVYCNMGTCMQCLVTVNGVHNVRACQTPVEPDMEIESRS